MNTIPRKSNAAAMARRRQRLIDTGMCVLCGGREATRGPRGGTTLCDTCRIRQHRWSVESRRRRIARTVGVCHACLRRPAVPGPSGGMTRCDICRAKRGCRA